MTIRLYCNRNTAITIRFVQDMCCLGHSSWFARKPFEVRNELSSHSLSPSVSLSLSLDSILVALNREWPWTVETVETSDHKGYLPFCGEENGSAQPQYLWTMLSHLGVVVYHSRQRINLSNVINAVLIWWLLLDGESPSLLFASHPFQESILTLYLRHWNSCLAIHCSHSYISDQIELN